MSFMRPTANAEYSVAQARVSLAALNSAAYTDEAIIVGPALAQACLDVLVRAELIAAKAGIVPLDTQDGVPGILIKRVGEAMANIDRAPSDVRTIYRAAHKAVADVVANARKTTFSGNAEYPLVTKLSAIDKSTEGAFPIAIALIVVGVVAVSAWGLAHEARQYYAVKAEEARQLAVISAALDMQAAGVPSSAPVWGVLSNLSNQPIPGDSPMVPPWLIAVVIAGAAAFAIYEAKEGRSLWQRV